MFHPFKIIFSLFCKFFLQVLLELFLCYFISEFIWVEAFCWGGSDFGFLLYSLLHIICILATTIWWSLVISLLLYDLASIIVLVWLLSMMISSMWLCVVCVLFVWWYLILHNHVVIVRNECWNPLLDTYFSVFLIHTFTHTSESYKENSSWKFWWVEGLEKIPDL